MLYLVSGGDHSRWVQTPYQPGRVDVTTNGNRGSKDGNSVMQPSQGDRDERDGSTDVETEGKKACKYGDERDGEIKKHSGGVGRSDGGSEGGGACGS